MAIERATHKSAAAYMRCSTDKQEQSVPDQWREITRYADQHGYTVVTKYVDEAISGASTVGRKGFQQMIRDACGPNRPFEFVLVYDVKRFSRADSDEAGHYRYILRQHGVEIVYVAEGLPGDDSDGLLLSVKQHMARGDSLAISRTTIRGQVTTARGGWWSGGTPPYGYDLGYFDALGKAIGRIRYLDTGERQLLDADGHAIRVLAKRERYRKSDRDKVRLVEGSPEHVCVVRRIFHDYVVGGIGRKAIADRLNRDKIPSPRNGTYATQVKGGWAASTIKGILENRAYVGDLVWNRRTSAKFHRVADAQHARRDRRDFGKLAMNSERDYIVKENAHAALIDRELFDRAQAIWHARRSRLGEGCLTGRAAKSRYLLSGLVHCGHCGHNFSGQPQNRGRRRKDGSPVKTFYYMCGGYLNKGKEICTGVRVPQSLIESFVLREIKTQIVQFLDGGGDALAKAMIRNAYANGDEGDQRLASVEQRMEAVQCDIDRLLGSITPAAKDEIGKQIGKLVDERRGLEAEKARLERVQKAVVDVESVVEEIAAQMRAFTSVFDEGTIEEKKEFVSLFVEKVVVDAAKGSVRVHIRQFPAPESLDTGNASFQMVAGAGFEPATFGL